MVVQIMSDLHLEMHRDGGLQFLESLEPEGVDILVLAGDIFAARSPEIVRERLGAFAARYPQVVYVPGNHEYYGSLPLEVDESLQQHGLSNLHLLNPGVVTLEGQRFVGCTLWFPPTEDEERYQWMVTDFRAIPGFVPWVREAYRVHARFLEEHVRPGDIVVTHHLPAEGCIAPQYAGSPTNRFFYARVDELVRDRGARLWIHGHTHSHVDFTLGSTRVVANPRGYPREPGCGFVERMLIHV